jgi:ribonuclease HII
MAGPVTAAAVALRADAHLPWFADVRDSKVLPVRERERLAAAIAATVPWALGWATAAEVDEVGLTEARRRAALRALQALRLSPDAVLSDALPLPVPGNVALVDADALCVSVAAASVIAKVARDAHMVALCERLPGYAFCRHKGYVTPEHKALLARRGPSPEHRRRFAPVSQLELPW